MSGFILLLMKRNIGVIKSPKMVCLLGSLLVHIYPPVPNLWKKLNLEDFEQKFKDTINLITKNAPIKIIHKNKNEAEIILMFNEIMNEIKKIELRKKIEFLEDKVSINLDETLYSELLLLRNQLKRG